MKKFTKGWTVGTIGMAFVAASYTFNNPWITMIIIFVASFCAVIIGDKVEK